MVSFHCNYDLKNIISPVDPDILGRLLRYSQYDAVETTFLVQGFKHGFHLGYEGPTKRRDQSRNLPFRVGDKFILWEKVMKEVKLKRYAGPFTDPSFSYFVQSPLGLVPKGQKNTRLIFHLSYDFSTDKSVNRYIPDDLCTVKYRDLDYAIKCCLKWCGTTQFGTQVIYSAKTDVRSAFRILRGARKSWPWSVMCAEHPLLGKKYFFVDKCLSFGSSISCALFQRFSDALKHIIEYQTGRTLSVTIFLDDFLFVAESSRLCDDMVSQFMNLCDQLGVPLAMEKTEPAALSTVFLGILLIGDKFVMAVSEDKCLKALNMAGLLLSKKKARAKCLQKFMGFLNFLNKAIFPGRAFTRRMYAKFSLHKDGSPMKPYHHVYSDKEFKNDCQMWVEFLESENKMQFCRPFVDVSEHIEATELDFYTDSSAAEALGFGSYFGTRWFFGQWEK